MKQTFLILNGTRAVIKTFTATENKGCEQLAYDYTVNYCDHSKELIVRPLSGIHNTTERAIPAHNVQTFTHK